MKNVSTFSRDRLLKVTDVHDWSCSHVSEPVHVSSTSSVSSSLPPNNDLFIILSMVKSSLNYTTFSSRKSTVSSISSNWVPLEWISPSGVLSLAWNRSIQKIPFILSTSLDIIKEFTFKSLTIQNLTKSQSSWLARKPSILPNVLKMSSVNTRSFWNFPNPAVTNYYLVGKLSTSLNLSSYLVSNGSKSLSISGGDNSCSWVLVRALGLIVKEEFKSVMLGRGWRCGELLVSSSTFTVIQRICKSVPPQKHPHWKNTNTQLQYSLYCYSWH